MCCTCAAWIVSIVPDCTLSLSSLSQKSSSTTALRIPSTKWICSNVHAGAVTLSASIMLLCWSLASFSFTPRKSSFPSDDRSNSSVYSVRWFYAVRPPILKTIFIKDCHVHIIAFPFMLFHRDRFFNFFRLFRHQFSAAYLLEFFLLPQRVHTTLYIKCDKPELTRWWLYSLHAGVQMSADKVVRNFESEIALSARMSTPSFAGSRCAFRFDQEGCCPCCNSFL